MKTYISDIIPKIQRFSQKLDNLTLLTNQHWVVIDDIMNTKNVYIFRQNNELLISQNGKVEKAKWEYLGHNSLLIDRNEESYLFKHGFFDENILALKIDSKDEYAFLVNETRFDQELNSLESIIDFLNRIYLKPEIRKSINITPDPSEIMVVASESIFSIREGVLIIRNEDINENLSRQKVFLNGKIAADGKYKLDFLHYIVVKDGIGEYSSSPF
ncbi:MAG TPA: hypothetical protein DCR40_14945 [Prolixibacteraceae bacterium]|nr:hypothetical protein [Prolixibacteraceae bacterium]